MGRNEAKVLHALQNVKNDFIYYNANSENDFSLFALGKNLKNGNSEKILIFIKMYLV